MNTFECLGCGRVGIDSERGCYVDELCAACTPAAGECQDCADLRRENDADLWERAAGDALREMHRGGAA